MTHEQPKEAAQRIFAKRELSASDVIERCATDPPLVVRSLLQLVAETPTGGRVCELGFGSGWLLEEMRRELTALLNRDGAFRLTRHSGAFVATV